MTNSRPLVDSVLNAEIQHEGRGHLVHPVVKAIFVVGPLIAGAVSLFGRIRGGHVENKWLLLLIVIIWACQSVDFRPVARRRTITTLAVCVVVAFGIELAAFHVIDFDTLIRVLSDKPLLHLVERYVSGQDILLIVMFATAGRGIIRFSASDMLWFRQWIPVRRVELAYVTAVVTYYVIQSTLRQHVAEAWRVGWRKRLQLRQTQGPLVALTLAAMLFLQRLLSRLSDLAQNAHSLLRERGMFDLQAIHDPAVQLSVEDIFALTALVVVALTASAALIR